ncbi:MAG: hypothetical protein AAB131_01390, partial [Actinomycetota bacterium]
FSEGLAAFAGSSLAAALGNEFSENFVALSTNELALFETSTAGSADPDVVTPWEFARYVEIG